MDAEVSPLNKCSSKQHQNGKCELLWYAFYGMFIHYDHFSNLTTFYHI